MNPIHSKSLQNVNQKAFPGKINLIFSCWFQMSILAFKPKKSTKLFCFPHSDDPQSTVICISGNTSYDVTFIRDINAGVFTALGESSSVRSCVRQACNMRATNAYLVAFLVEKNCYMVRCHSKGHCMTKPSDSPSHFRISITPYTWFGE